MHTDRPTHKQPAPRLRGQVVNIAADHPTLGKVYWSCVAGSDCKSPCIYTLTTDVQDAGQRTAGWRDLAPGSDQILHIPLMLADEHQVMELAGTVLLSGVLAQLQRRSGQKPSQFIAWVRTAIWSDLPAPARRLSWSDEVYGWPTSQKLTQPYGEFSPDLDFGWQADRPEGGKATIH